VLARELDLSELVPNHELLDLGHERRIHDRLDVPAVAGIGRDPAGRRMRVAEQPGELELGQDVADGRARHAEAVTLDEQPGCRPDSRSIRIPR